MKWPVPRSDKRLIRVASYQKTSGNEAKRLGVSVLNKEKMKVYEAMQDYSANHGISFIRYLCRRYSR